MGPGGVAYLFRGGDMGSGIYFPVLISDRLERKSIDSSQRDSQNSVRKEVTRSVSQS